MFLNVFFGFLYFWFEFIVTDNGGPLIGPPFFPPLLHWISSSYKCARSTSTEDVTKEMACGES